MGKLTLANSVSYFVSQFLKQATYTKLFQLPLLELIKVGGKNILSSIVLALTLPLLFSLKMYNKKSYFIFN